MLGRAENKSTDRAPKCMACLESLICFISFDRVSGYRAGPSATDIMYLDFSRAFVQACHNITVDNMEK